MTECLGQGGRPCQEVGVERQGGRRGGDLAAGAQTNLLISPDWKKLFGLHAFAQSHGIYYTSWLDRFLSVIQSDAAWIFSKPELNKRRGLFPPHSVQNHIVRSSDSPAHRGSTSRWGPVC